MERVLVAVRIRPPGSSRSIQTSGNSIILRKHEKFHCEHGKSSSTSRASSSDYKQTYSFDHVLDAKATQDDVFRVIGRPLLDDVLSGYNGCIMAYGQTGAGKTYTLSELGSGRYGLIPQCCRELFSRIEAQRLFFDYTVHLSYLQIYMETIQDLLQPPSEPVNLPIREDPAKGVYVVGLTQRICRNLEDVLSLMALGARSRAVAQTQMNIQSSRSHAVLTLRISRAPRQVFRQKRDPSLTKVAKEVGIDINRDNKRVFGKLVFVDLAGCERVAKTQPSGVLLEETKSINRSLSTLGNVIAALAKRNEKRISHTHSLSFSHQEHLPHTSNPREILSSREYHSLREGAFSRDGEGSVTRERRIDDKTPSAEPFFSLDIPHASTQSVGPPVTSLSAASDSFIPWRDSKLTRLLTDVLGGNSRNTLIINLNPSDNHIAQSISSLQFGRRAMCVSVHPVVNVELDFESMYQKLLKTVEDMKSQKQSEHTSQEERNRQLMEDLRIETERREEAERKEQEWRQKYEVTEEERKQLQTERNSLQREVDRLKNRLRKYGEFPPSSAEGEDSDLIAISYPSASLSHPILHSPYIHREFTPPLQDEMPALSTLMDDERTVITQEDYDKSLHGAEYNNDDSKTSSVDIQDTPILSPRMHSVREQLSREQSMRDQSTRERMDSLARQQQSRTDPTTKNRNRTDRPVTSSEIFNNAASINHPREMTLDEPTHQFELDLSSFKKEEGPASSIISDNSMLGTPDALISPLNPSSVIHETPEIQSSQQDGDYQTTHEEDSYHSGLHHQDAHSKGSIRAPDMQPPPSSSSVTSALLVTSQDTATSNLSDIVIADEDDEKDVLQAVWDEIAAAKEAMEGLT
ncbi:hypothetical protein ADUPG1_013378, partial [Aduncisulcus paluster]